MTWIDYARAILWFHLVGIAALYALLRLQSVLPLNPQQFDAMSPHLALNTAVSFATNTSWQSYGGESIDARPFWHRWRGLSFNRSCPARPG